MDSSNNYPSLLLFRSNNYLNLNTFWNILLTIILSFKSKGHSTRMEDNSDRKKQTILYEKSTHTLPFKSLASKDIGSIIKYDESMGGRACAYPENSIKGEVLTAYFLAINDFHRGLSGPRLRGNWALGSMALRVHMALCEIR